MLQNTAPIPEKTVDPFFNMLPYDENDIATRRVADVVLTPLISRAKRQIELEKRQELNKYFNQQRSRRQAQQPQGKFRGQTQSQYLSIGTDEQKEGKAEAEATQQSSRSVVSEYFKYLSIVSLHDLMIYMIEICFKAEVGVWDKRKVCHLVVSGAKIVLNILAKVHPIDMFNIQALALVMLELLYQNKILTLMILQVL